MPRKKASRAPSRAKPTLPDVSVTMVDLEAEERKKKLELLLKDFDVQVAEKLAEMEKEIQTVQDSIRSIYKRDLTRYSEATRNMLWSDYIKQDKERGAKVRTSVDDLLDSAEVLLATNKSKKGEGKASSKSTRKVPLSASKSTRSNRQKNVLGTSQVDNMYPPVSTVKASRAKKLNVEAATTPAGQGIPTSLMTSMFVTPKFDPRTPLPAGTIKRKPRVGEIAISLTGSPLQVSPKGWFSTLSDDMDDQTREELKLFHERVGALLNL